MSHDSEQQTYRVQVLERAASILKALAEQQEPQRLSQLSKLVGLNRGTVFRLLQALTGLGWVDRVDGDSYQIGLELFHLGQSSRGLADLGGAVGPELEWLVEHTEETAHLVVPHQSAGLYLAKVESQHSLRVPSQVGRTLPLHCTGVGKAILAYLNPAEVRRMVKKDGLARFTEHTICNEFELLDELAEIRKRGYSVDREEIEIGLRCVAAPVFDRSGRVAGGISIAGPTVRLSDQSIAKKAAVVMEAAARVSRRLGFSPLLVDRERSMESDDEAEEPIIREVTAGPRQHVP